MAPTYAETYISGRTHRDGRHFSATMRSDHDAQGGVHWSVSVRLDDQSVGTVPARSRGHARSLFTRWVEACELPTGLSWPAPAGADARATAAVPIAPRTTTSS